MNIKRRDFLWFTGLATGSVAIPSILTGCAIDPVTGKATFSLVSEAQEIEIDQQQSPHQFSADYGANSNAALNRYVSQIGASIASVSDRPQMPYNYHVLDANHVNAYTFPAGSMGVTRGIMVEMESEAELAALLGHEIGHVNARHSAERTSKGMLAQAAVGLASSAAGNSTTLQGVVAGVSSLSATALLSKYSRDNEREADRLGMKYSVAAGANPNGMVELMELLNSLNSSTPGAMDIMFSSHPMSAERLANTKNELASSYSSQTSRNMGRERYMDMTASLRPQKTLIKGLANADLALSAGEYDAATAELNKVQAAGQNDYAYWIIAAKRDIGTNQLTQANSALSKAEQLKPAEQLPVYMKGANYLQMNQPDQALQAFQSYKAALPGNPTIDFLIGYSYEMQDNKSSAATAYNLFLQQVQSGPQAEHAYAALVSWGYIS